MCNSRCVSAVLSLKLEDRKGSTINDLGGGSGKFEIDFIFSLRKPLQFFFLRKAFLTYFFLEEAFPIFFPAEGLSKFYSVFSPWRRPIFLIEGALLNFFLGKGL